MKRKIGKAPSVLCSRLSRRRIFKSAGKNERPKPQLYKPKIVEQNRNDETPLNMISRDIKTKAEIETVKKLLRDGADLMYPDIDDVTPAKYLLLTKDSSLIDLVLMKLQDVQAPLDPNRNTALHIAVKSCDRPTVSKLLKCRANPNIKNSMGYTPIHLAVITWQHDSLKDMMRHGGDINIPGPEGVTPVHMAVRMISKTTLKAVLAFKPNTNVLNSVQLSPLMELVMLNEETPVPLIHELLEGGADPGFANSKGYNCLHLCLDRGLIKNVKINVFNFLLRLFIQYGLDINAVTKDKGETALHIALRNSQDLIVLSLLRYGSDLMVEAQSGKALDVAINRRSQDILMCIVTHISLKKAPILKYIAKIHKKSHISEVLNLLILCKKQLENLKSEKLRGKNISCYDILTMSTEDFAWIVPNNTTGGELVLGVDCYPTFRIMLFYKFEDAHKCNDAYRRISFFLGILICKSLRNAESAQILYKLIVPHFKYNDALQLERRLKKDLEDDWHQKKGFKILDSYASIDSYLTEIEKA